MKYKSSSCMVFQCRGQGPAAGMQSNGSAFCEPTDWSVSGCSSCPRRGR